MRQQLLAFIQGLGGQLLFPLSVSDLEKLSTTLLSLSSVPRRCSTVGGKRLWASSMQLSAVLWDGAANGDGSSLTAATEN